PAARRRRRADERARLRARRARGAATRHHAGLSRLRDPLRPRAQAVRKADRRVPAHPGQNRRHVRRAAVGACLYLRRGQGLRRRPDHALRRGGRDPARERECLPRRRRGRAGPGRCGLHQGLAGRTLPARRQAARHRGRHQRDPPHADRPRADRGCRVSNPPSAGEERFSASPSAIPQVAMLIWTVGFLLGAASHAADVFTYGWLPYEFMPLGFNLYWTSLLFLDPVAALLIWWRPAPALVLGCLIMASDVLVNAWTAFVA